jgi:hypothetical protein
MTELDLTGVARTALTGLDEVVEYVEHVLTNPKQAARRAAFLGAGVVAAAYIGNEVALDRFK